MFLDGFQVIFKVAMALLKLNEEELLSTQDEAEIFMLLKDIPRRVFDGKTLCEVATTKFISINQKKISDLRQKYYQPVKEDIEEKTRKREAALLRRKKLLEAQSLEIETPEPSIPVEDPIVWSPRPAGTTRATGGVRIGKRVPSI